MTADEHPSGLRDAIAAAINAQRVDRPQPRSVVIDAVETAVVSWLSVVSEEERTAAAREYCLMSAAGYGRRGEPLSQASMPASLHEMANKVAERMLAASREVLIPQEQS